MVISKRENNFQLFSERRVNSGGYIPSRVVKSSWLPAKIAFLRFCLKLSIKIIFYLPVKSVKANGIFCITALFIAQISSFKKVSNGDAILALVTKR